MSSFDSVKINGTSLRPAPFVSTQYEYNKSGEYVIGGLLIITLSGTLVDEQIQTKIDTLNDFQKNADCVTVTIGCNGSTDFLDGSGRIRTITFSPSDQPYVVGYSMIIAIESISGKPAIEVDADFLSDNCLKNSIQFLQNYSEKLSFQGDGSVITNVDSNLKVSKSYVKISGEINVSSYGRQVCGVPSYDAKKNSEDILKERAQALLSINACNNTVLQKYSGWQKWLDTKKLTVNLDSSLTWSFDMYLSKGSATPYAWIDITNEDKKDQVKLKKNSTISGKIQGLSSATISDYLGNKVNKNERIANAQKAYDTLLNTIQNGTWPLTDVVLVGEEPKSSNANKPSYCYQRISSSVVKSVVAGEISFTAEFADISTCTPIGGVGTVDVTVDETLTANRYIEYISPGYQKPIIQNIGSTPQKVNITARGTLNGCDVNEMPQLIKCVDEEFNTAYNNTTLTPLILLSEKKNIGKFTYTVNKEYLYCDSGGLGTNCTTKTKPIYLYEDKTNK